MAPGQPQREDYEYRRRGARNLFRFCEPRAGWCHAAITERRATEDFAHRMQWLVDEAYPAVPLVRLVLDTLNTHRKGALYQTFPAPPLLSMNSGGASLSGWNFTTLPSMAAG